jgi:cysteine-rich repeat protein
MARMIFRLLTMAVALAALASPSQALVNLGGGQRLMAADSFNPRQDRITFRFARDPGLFSLQSPLCPTQTKIQLVTNSQVTAEQTLDCTKWRVAGSGFRYQDMPFGPGSVRRIAYRVGTLVVTLKGMPYANGPVVGPVDFLETRVSIGSAQYCGRWDQPPGVFLRNLPSKIVVKGPTTSCVTACGNGILESPEACDDGDLQSGDGCDANCTPTGCGNGIVTAGEQCDDGNLVNGDGCSSTCQIQGCGNGVLDPGEQCDDGNLSNADCCSATCTFRPAGSACPTDNNPCTDDVCNGAGTCTHPANSASCNDGEACTVGDTCVGGICVGEYLEPWINEVDYDGPGNDVDEFIELAAPAGKDLSGYRVIAVEGAGVACLTGSSAAGQAYSIGTLPAGTVVGNDTGTGVGFVVVCFTGTSASVSGCDVTLPGDASTSNLKDGNLLNLDETSCPDGVLLLDPLSNYVDSVSWEGIVQNAAPFGSPFHTFPPYSISRDDGQLAGVSIEKTTSTLARATSATEWRDPSELGSVLTCQNQVGLTCPTNTRTPGSANPGQSLICPFTPPYGSASRAFLQRPQSLLD